MATKGLKAWVKKLSQEELPVLAGVVRELNELTGSDDADVNQLAEVILRDASLTSQVLRIANSVHYNPASFPINTVSRAIVLIGFVGVRAICISTMIIDTLLGKEPRQRLLEIMARSFHAAVQARNLVRHTKDEVKEEVFIAALLYHLGDMAFWACGGQAADELDRLLQEDVKSLRDAMEEVLGTTFKSLSRELAQLWRLGPILEEALKPPGSIPPRVVAVLLGEEISREAIKGWDSPNLSDTLMKVARFTGTDFTKAKSLVKESADEAASVALTYGAAQLCQLIPSSKELHSQPSPDQRVLVADAQVQLDILREMSNAVAENLDVNTVFQMSLEGLHRGIGLERVAVAFLQRGAATARYVLGDKTDGWRDKLRVPVGPQDENIFSYAIQQRQPLWLTADFHRAHRYLYSAELNQLLGRFPAFMAVICIQQRDVAVFYADRADFGGELDDVQFQAFRHFMMQTQVSLELLAGRRNSG